MVFLRVMTFNIQHGKGLDGKVRINRTVEFIKRFQPDILALNEVDLRVLRSFCLNQPKVLAQGLKMKYIFHPLLKIPPGNYGNALLYKGDVLECERYALPFLMEPRGCMRAKIMLGVYEFEVLVVHLGVSKKERDMQLLQLENLVQASQLPKIVLGDFNQDSLSSWLKEAKLFQPLHNSKSTAILSTFPQPRPNKQIDYILLSEHWITKKIFSRTTDVSDHGPLISDIVLKERFM